MNAEELRKEIGLYLDEMNEEQLEFMMSLLSINRYINKDEIIKIFADGKVGTFDSAVDINRYRQIAEVYPAIKEAITFQDYTGENAHGQFRNMNDIIAQKVLEFFGTLW